MPPFIYLLALLVIIAFVVGVSFLYQGYTAVAKAGTDPKEVQLKSEELARAAAEAEDLRSQANTLAVQLDEMKGKLTWAENNVKSLEETLRKSSDALARLDQADKDLQFLSQKADAQAREAYDVITRIAAENETLKLQVANAATEDLDAARDENQKLKIQVDGYASKLKNLEDALKAAEESGGKTAQIAELKDKLAQENNVLKAQLGDFEGKIKTLLNQAEETRASHAGTVAQLETKISELEQKVRDLFTAPSSSPVIDVPGIEEELRRVRAANDEAIAAANASIVRLNQELDDLQRVVAEKDQRIKDLTRELFASRDKLLNLQGASSGNDRSANRQDQEVDPDKENLLKRLEQLAMDNQRLRDKERVLLYKLAQARHQAMGLENAFGASPEGAGERR